MNRFVVDNSVVMSWAFSGEESGYADRVLDSLRQATGVVPRLWSLEAANVLAVAERIGRLTEPETRRFLTMLEGLPIEVIDRATAGIPLARDLLSLARDHELSAYDAAYLGLAIDHDLPIATLDAKLREAAKQAGTKVWQTE